MSVDMEKVGLSIKNIVVSKGFRAYIIPVSEIMMFFYENRNVFVVTRSKEVLSCDMDLAKIEDEINCSFFRINRQVIINFSAIEYYSQEVDYSIVISAKVTIPEVNLSVSKNKVSKFKNWLVYECAHDIPV